MSQAQPSVTEIERDLIFEVSQQNPKAIQLIYSIRSVWAMSKGDFPYLDSLRWLIRNQIKGKIFIEFMEEKFDNGVVGACSYLRQKVNSEYKKRPFFAGK